MKRRLPAFPSATAAGAIGLRARFVDVQRAAIEVPPVDGSNCLLAFAIVCHFHEAEAARLTSVAIGGNVDTTDCTVGFKQRTDRFFRSPKTEGSNVNVLGYSSFAGLQAVNLAGGRR